MPDDTDNVSELMAGQLYRTNWFPDSLADNAQKRPLAPPGLPLVVPLPMAEKRTTGRLRALRGTLAQRAVMTGRNGDTIKRLFVLFRTFSL